MVVLFWILEGMSVLIRTKGGKKTVFPDSSGKIIKKW